MEYEFTRPDDALQMMLEDITSDEFSVESTSRNGNVRRFKQPVLIQHKNPFMYLIHSKIRDANPVFHIMEAFWILRGHNEVDYLTPFNAKYIDYAESNGKVHGAYGRRLINGQFNQLEIAIKELQKTPDSRQVVLSMWIPELDLGVKGLRDRPCNTQIFLRIDEQGQLDMSVQQRSGDLVWGTMGANRVCFAIMQDYLATALGVGVGTLWQYVMNLHLYESVFDKYHGIVDEKLDHIPATHYESKSLCLGGASIEMLKHDMDLALYFGKNHLMKTGSLITGWETPYFQKVFGPALDAYAHFKRKEWEKAFSRVAAIEEDALRLNLSLWLTRRHVRAK